MELVSKTICQCFEDRVEKTPNSLFIKDSEEFFTWKYVNYITNKLAAVLVNQGITPGTRVGIIGFNSPSWVMAFLSIQKIGAVSVLINSCYKEKELEDCINIADIKYLLYTGKEDNNSIEKVVKGLRNNVKLGFLKSFNIEKTFGEWKKFLERSKFDFDETINNRNPEDLACILFTSGTTNNCKGVMLSHYSLINNARAVVEEMGWKEDDQMCLSVPLFHCFGITVSLISSIIGGMGISLLEKYKTTNVCRAIENDGCTILNGVPSMFLALIKNPKMKNYNLSSLKSGIIAGSPIFKDEYIEISKRLPQMKIQTSYGLTEASPCVSISRYGDSIERKSISAGKIIEHVDVKIYNSEKNKICKPQEQGEIFVRGYNVTLGYLSSDPVLCDAVQKDGWLKTGDLGYLDEDNYLYIVGRRKNLIIRGGENISPNEIESYIKKVKNGLEVFVYGKKSEVIQEEIIACIEGAYNPKLESDILVYLKENISRYKIPSCFVFIESFPRNATGKINEKEIKILADIELEGKKCPIN